MRDRNTEAKFAARYFHRMFRLYGMSRYVRGNNYTIRQFFSGQRNASGEDWYASDNGLWMAARWSEPSRNAEIKPEIPELAASRGDPGSRDPDRVQHPRATRFPLPGNVECGSVTGAGPNDR